jgi:hypothetical protein
MMPERARKKKDRRSNLVFLFTSLLLAGPLAGCGSGEEKGVGEQADPTGGQPQAAKSDRTAATLELEATYPEGFSFLNGVRELPDGTVLAADPLAQVLLRIDLDASTADTMGRVGPGPQEYEQPDQVFPLPENRSLLVDLGKMQLTQIARDGRFEGGIPMTIPKDDGFPTILHPRFVDDQGMLFQQAPRPREGGPPDSAAVTRFDRATGVVDTVATVWLPELQMTRSRGRGFLPRLLEATDAWAVGPEGQIVIIRARDFSPEWIFPGGRYVTGPPLPFPEIPVSREDKTAMLEEFQNSGISMTSSVSRESGVQRMTMTRGIRASGDSPGIDDFEWAETFPPFHSDRAIVSFQGEVWVQRHLPLGEKSQWEVFGQEGLWQGSVTLPSGYQLLAFGHGGDGREVAYLTRTDEFQLKWLERHEVVR